MIYLHLTKLCHVQWLFSVDWPGLAPATEPPAWEEKDTADVLRCFTVFSFSVSTLSEEPIRKKQSEVCLKLFYFLTELPILSDKSLI